MGQVPIPSRQEIFYTLEGQYQLFYNMMAALDQVDWTELATARKAIEEGQEIKNILGWGYERLNPYSYTRSPYYSYPYYYEYLDELNEYWPIVSETLLQSETGSTDPRLAPADILTRAITLEGTDLYSDYLVRMFGAEHGRRNATSELVRSLCDYGLGLKDCEFDTKDKEPEEIAEMLDYRNQAVVSNIWRWINMPFTSGVIGALSSGMEEEPLLDTAGNVIGTVPSDAEVRENLWLSDGPDRVPYAYSEDIASWRQWVKNNTATSFDRIYHERALNQLLVDTARKYISTGTEYPLRNIMFDSTGRPHPRPGPNGTISEAKQEIGTYEMLLAEYLFEGEAEEAVDRVSTQQEFAQQRGLLADMTLASDIGGYKPWGNVPWPPSPSPGPSNSPPPSVSPSPTPRPSMPPLGEISWLIENPVAARVAGVNSVPIAMALLDTRQKASSLAGIDEPGSYGYLARPGLYKNSWLCLEPCPGEWCGTCIGEPIKESKYVEGAVCCEGRCPAPVPACPGEWCNYCEVEDRIYGSLWPRRTTTYRIPMCCEAGTCTSSPDPLCPEEGQICTECEADKIITYNAYMHPTDALCCSECLVPAIEEECEGTWCAECAGEPLGGPSALGGAYCCDYEEGCAVPLSYDSPLICEGSGWDPATETEGQVLGTEVVNTEQVLGTLDLFEPNESDYDTWKKPFSQWVNIAAGHLEQGVVEALRTFTAYGFRGEAFPLKACGFTCYYELCSEPCAGAWCTAGCAVGSSPWRESTRIKGVYCCPPEMDADGNPTGNYCVPKICTDDNCTMPGEVITFCEN